MQVSWPKHQNPRGFSFHVRLQNEGSLVSSPRTGFTLLTLLVLQSRFGDKALRFQVVCPHNGTAVLLKLQRRKSMMKKRRLLFCTANGHCCVIGCHDTELVSELHSAGTCTAQQVQHDPTLTHGLSRCSYRRLATPKGVVSKYVRRHVKLVGKSCAVKGFRAACSTPK